MKTSYRPSGRALLVGTMLTTGWSAGANLISNGSFEEFTRSFTANAGAGVVELSGGIADSGAIPGWSVISGINAWGHPAGIALETSASGFSPSQGSYFLNLAGADGTSHFGGVTLDQPIATIPGQHYKLTFDLGSCSQASGDPVNPVMRVMIDGQPGAQYFTGDNQVAGTGSAKSYWQMETITFTANSVATFVTFNNCTAFRATDAFVGLDNVVLVQVPDSGPSLGGVAALFLVVGAFGSCWRPSKAWL